MTGRYLRETGAVQDVFTITKSSATVSADNPGNQIGQQGDPVSLQIVASDSDGDSLTYSATGLPVALTINPTTGLISGSLNDSLGVYSVTVSVTDGTEVASVEFNWTIGALSNCTVEVDFESGASGWTNSPSSTCSTGTFVPGTPAEIVNSGVTTQVGGDHTSGSGQALYTAVNTSAGSNDVDGGECLVESPTYNVAQDSNLSIWYFHGQRDAGDDPGGDYFHLEYSLNSGASWTSLVNIGDVTSQAVWSEATTNIAAGSSVKLRAAVSDGSGPGDLVEGGLDDLTICSSGGGANTPPQVTNPGDQSDVANSSVNFQISASDTDGDPLTYSATGLPDGLSINSVSGLILGTISASPQVFAVEVNVNDGADTSSVNFSWTITADNDPPQITDPGNQTNAEGETVNLAVSASDPDGDTLIYSATGLPPGLSINVSTGAISGTLDFVSAGSYNVDVTASDGIFSPSVSFSWVVTDVNRAPSFDAVIADQFNTEGDTVNLSAGATDPDGDSLTYSATNLPDDLTINPVTGAITGTLSATSAGSYIVQVAVSDGSLSDVQTFNWTVADVNHPPVFDSPPADQVNNPGDMVSLSANATDPDGDPLTYSATGLPVALTINPTTGLISGSLNDSLGVYPVTVSVTDGTEVASVEFNWTISALSNCTAEVDFESGASGWTNSPSSTCSTGTFITGTPAEMVNSGVTTQVGGDHTSGSGQALYTAVNTSAGSNDVDGGECLVESPTYNVTQDSNLSIWYFHGQRDAGDDAGDDYFHLEYSLNSGASWTSLVNIGDVTSQAVWSEATTNIAAGSSVKLRAAVSDGSGPGDLVEGGLDDLTICSSGGGANTPPQVTNPGDRSDVANSSVNLQISASDTDGDPLTYSATGLPDGLSINSASGLILGTISASPQVFAVEVSVNDGADTSSVNFSWVITPTGGQMCTVYSNNTPVSLPNGVASINSNIDVNDSSGSLSDVNVSIDMDHAWVGDLSFTLTHSGSGANVVILDRPGQPASSWGCDGDNLLVTLDDDAGSAVETQCADSTPTISGSYTPNNPLSGFSGIYPDGTWTLMVNDAYTPSDSGVLNNWSIEICHVN